MIAAPEIADRLISCFAATKTFNLAGAHVGACVTSNPALKRKLDARIAASGLSSYNLFGMLATEAAWRTGEAWLDALLPYLARNRDMLDAGIEAAVPGARSMRLDATYLAWVDFSGTGIAPAEVADRVASRARIYASPGPQFGPGGDNGCASTSPRRGRSSRTRWGVSTTPLRICESGSENRAMKRPVVGVIGSAHIVENRFPAQRAGERNLMAVHDVVGALPLIFAGDPALTDIDALLDAVDGVLLTGARANVHPEPLRRR